MKYFTQDIRFLHIVIIDLHALWARMDAEGPEVRAVTRCWTGDTEETEWLRPDEGGEG